MASLLNRADLAALETISLPPRPVPAGVEFVRENEAADRVHIIRDGWAIRYKTTRDGNRQIVGLALPGELANVDSMLFERVDFGVRPVTAATIVSVARLKLAALAAERPGVARAITWIALVENATLCGWAMRIGRQSAARRLAHLLCEIAARVGVDGDGGSFEMPLTQTHLADAVGLTPMHVNRVLQAMRADGLIATAGRKVTVPDIARLRAEADFEAGYLHRPGDRATYPTLEVAAGD